MTVYHVETQEAYDQLMSELEVKGYEWLSGYKPTEHNYWEQSKEDSCINISSKYITFMNIEQSKKQHPNIPIIEYKAKGENMTQEEMKHNLQEAVESFARGISNTEADLQEAKTSAKKLIEKIDEYFETLKPKFKVGDYVTFDIPNKKIAKIDRLNGALYGLWYDTESENIKDDLYFGSGNKFRHATPTEILEYEVVLTFLKHDRKPFEVKEGDILRDDEGNIFSVNVPGVWNKENFTSGDYTFLKTIEEVSEWIENKEKTEK